MQQIVTAAPPPPVLPSCFQLSSGSHISKETKGRRGGDTANHIMGHEINPASPNIWPSHSLTLKLLFTSLHEDFIKTPSVTSKRASLTLQQWRCRGNNSIGSFTVLMICCNFISLTSVSYCNTQLSRGTLRPKRPLPP